MKGRMVERISTGVFGLDEVLDGGLICGSTYLVRGGPGTGKTTLGLHFLTEGAARGEKVLLISLAATEKEIRQEAGSIGFDLKGIDVLDLTPSPEFFSKDQSYDIFLPVEEERVPTTRMLVDAVEKLQPRRVVVDAVTSLRYLALNPQEFRRQIFSLLQYLKLRGATVIASSEASPTYPDDDLQFITDGVISLDYSATGRRLEVSKFHGSDFSSGRHSLSLTDRGVRVYPLLRPEAHHREVVRELLPFGIPELDELLRGGVTRGMITIISGPSGVGKTTLGLQFMKEAAGRGERSVVFTFEEGAETVVTRSQAVGIPVKAMIERGTLALVSVEPLRMDTEEFACAVRQQVEVQGTTTVMIDSIAGFRMALRGEDLRERLHALCRYLENMGITTLLINETEAITGEFRATEMGISYLADNIIFLRYLEIRGELRKAIGVLKKRLTPFERSLREVEITPYGLKVGRPLTELRGILSGIPEWSPTTQPREVGPG